MKKFLLIVMATLLSLTAFAQTDVEFRASSNHFLESNRKDCVSVDISYSHLATFTGNEGANGFSLGLNASNLYVDGVFQWYQGTFIGGGHIGLTIPMLDAFSHMFTITPAIGYCRVEDGNGDMDYGLVIHYSHYNSPFGAVVKMYDQMGISVGITLNLY